MRRIENLTLEDRIYNLERLILKLIIASILFYQIYVSTSTNIWFNLIIAFLVGLLLGDILFIFWVISLNWIDKWQTALITEIKQFYLRYQTVIKFIIKWGTVSAVLWISKNLLGYSWGQVIGVLVIGIVANWIWQILSVNFLKNNKN